jgi:hypothetical protein
MAVGRERVATGESGPFGKRRGEGVGFVLIAGDENFHGRVVLDVW